jgi:outer membrane immunogenic protein
MNHTFLGAVGALVLLTSGTFAADLPRKPQPAPMLSAMSPYNWSGCYIGANIGGAFGNASVTGSGGSGGEVSTNGSGFAGGGQIGCDYQFAGTGWVIGFRNMFDGTSNKRSGTIPGPGPLAGDVVNFNNQWFDTLTGRIGYAVQPAWLLYFQGGGAWAHTSTNITNAALGQIGQTSNTRSGWTIGGGVEWMFAPHWSAFLEGNYMDFGTKNGTVVGVAACAAGCAFAAKATETTVLVGVNYRFW